MLQQTSSTQLEQAVLTGLRSVAYDKAQMFEESDAYFEAFMRLANGMIHEQLTALREFILNGEHATSLASEIDGITPPDYFAGYQLLSDGRVYAEYVTHKRTFDHMTYTCKWVEEDRMRVLIDQFGAVVNF
jgi:hypothetical protein